MNSFSLFQHFCQEQKMQKSAFQDLKYLIKITTKIWYLLEVKVFSKTFKVNFYVKAHQLGFYVKINLESFKGRASHIVGMYIHTFQTFLSDWGVTYYFWSKMKLTFTWAIPYMYGVRNLDSKDINGFPDFYNIRFWANLFNGKKLYLML